MTIVKEEADESMTDVQEVNIDAKLSHSAKALLKTIKKLEDDLNLDLFQPDPDLERLRMQVSTFKGGFYASITRRLEKIISRGGVDIVTSSDLMEIVQGLWERSISRLSKTELQVLEGVLVHSDMNLRGLSEHIGLSYGRTRRALEQLRLTRILRHEGRPDVTQLGLDRIIIMMENCQAIPDSPYFTRYLYSDGAVDRVFIKGLIPSRKRKEFIQTIRTLRTVSDKTSIWALSSGGIRFSDTYFDQDEKEFQFDPIHFRLLLRAGGGELTIGSFSIGEIRFPKRFNSSEMLILESLLRDFEKTAQEIVEDTGVSESTAFRRRKSLLKQGVIHSRPKIEVPSLSDRVLGVFSAETASRIINAWGYLPLTYISQITDLEDPRKRKIIFATALPTGSAPDLIDILSSEMSRIDDYQVYEINAGLRQELPAATLYDTKTKMWKFDIAFFDVRNYSICRKEASRKNIPLDLA